LPDGAVEYNPVLAGVIDWPSLLSFAPDEQTRLSKFLTGYYFLMEQPVHQLLLIAMGTPIFDNCDLEKLGDEANKRKRWEFLLTASPLPVTGGTGSPINPIATF